jgi:hypothetical protein
MSRDEYEFGPEHAWYTARGHKIGSMSYGRKIKRPPTPQQGTPGPRSLHHRAMRIAGLVIAVMLAADVLGDAFGNGAEIAWVALGGLAVAAAGAAAAVTSLRRRRSGLPALYAPEPLQAIGADPVQLALEHELQRAGATLAHVLTAAREREDRPPLVPAQTRRPPHH